MPSVSRGPVGFRTRRGKTELLWHGMAWLPSAWRATERRERLVAAPTMTPPTKVQATGVRAPASRCCETLRRYAKIHSIIRNHTASHSPPCAAGREWRVCVVGSVRSAIVSAPRITAKPLLLLSGAMVQTKAPQHPAAATVMALGRLAMATALSTAKPSKLGHEPLRDKQCIEACCTSTDMPSR